jgi:hypothetical protein
VQPRGRSIREAGRCSKLAQRATYAHPTVSNRLVPNFALILSDATSIADRIYNKTVRLCTVASAYTSVAKGRRGRWQRD